MGWIILKIVDTHAHIDQLMELDKVIANAKENDVNEIIAMSVNGASSKKTLELAKKYSKYVYPCIGVHPTEWLDENLVDTFDWMKQNIKNCVAIGEIGLDYWGKFSKREDLRQKQREIYSFQLSLAVENELPVSIHSRGAWRDCIKIALESGVKKAVFHWYTGPQDTINQIIDNGFYVSCTPALEYSKDLRNIIENAPLNSILVETDSPVYIRSIHRASEPSDVLLTAKHLGFIKGCTLDEVADITSKNAYNLFKINN
jgi:TatD DNase family protein